MKLRRLELVNVRRFGGQRAVLGPFGDGLTTITAENESGKSTFLDALHALFFVAHGSSSQEVKSLQPHSGGAVGVAAEIEVDGKAFRVEKSFLVQKSAKVIDVATGQVIKQQGDAEAWIEDRINKSNKGPAGLLWVRQGATHVDPEGKDKDASNVATRRDLMSSVRGQIDAVTGGRRMDRIVAQCRKELDALATKSLRAKAGSPWKTIEDDVEALTARKAALAADVKALADALATKRRANLRLKALQDPHKDADRAAHITDAAKALEEARHHDQSVTQAEGALALLAGQTATLGRQIGEFEATRERRRLLAREVDLKEKDAALTRAARASSDAALAEAQRVIAGSQEARDTLAKELQAARKAERSREKWNRLCIVANQKGQVASPLKRRSDADLILGQSEIGQADLDGIADLGRRMSIAHEQRRTQFARFEIAPEGGAIATRDGASVAPEVSHLIDQDMVIALAGFGEITLSPAAGTGQGIEDPEAIGVQLRAALGALGVSTANEARAAFNARQSAMNDRAVAIAELRALTPDGVDVLDSDDKGAVVNGPDLSGAAYGFACQQFGALPLHKGQVSVIYPDYPKARMGESDAALNYRIKRDAAHLDGLKLGDGKRRFMDEYHAYVLGISLTGSAQSPLVVWEGSHEPGANIAQWQYWGSEGQQWRINSDEATVTDYNLDFGRDPTLYNGDTPARNSDHDPVIVGFDFRSEIIGTEDKDRLVGTEFDDLIDGLDARDKYIGLGGADTFVMGDGDNDKIRDFSFTDGDLIDVSAWGVQSFEELDIAGRGRAVNIFDNVGHNRGRVKFDDRDARGDDLTAENFIFAPVEDLVLTGGRRFDRLEGRAGDDLIDGGKGFNNLTGNGGADTFVIQNLSFNVINDFEVGADLIDVSALGAGDIGDLSIRDTIFGTLVRSKFGVAKVKGVDADDLDAGSFVFLLLAQTVLLFVRLFILG